MELYGTADFFNAAKENREKCAKLCINWMGTLLRARCLNDQVTVAAMAPHRYRVAGLYDNAINTPDDVLFMQFYKDLFTRVFPDNLTELPADYAYYTASFRYPELTDKAYKHCVGKDWMREQLELRFQHLETLVTPGLITESILGAIIEIKDMFLINKNPWNRELFSILMNTAELIKKLAIVADRVEHKESVSAALMDHIRGIAIVQITPNRLVRDASMYDRVRLSISMLLKRIGVPSDGVYPVNRLGDKVWEPPAINTVRTYIDLSGAYLSAVLNGDVSFDGQRSVETLQNFILADSLFTDDMFYKHLHVAEVSQIKGAMTQVGHLLTLGYANPGRDDDLNQIASGLYSGLLRHRYWVRRYTQSGKTRRDYINAKVAQVLLTALHTSGYSESDIAALSTRIAFELSLDDQSLTRRMLKGVILLIQAGRARKGTTGECAKTFINTYLVNFQTTGVIDGMAHAYAGSIAIPEIGNPHPLSLPEIKALADVVVHLPQHPSTFH